jgi:hypothetical protein
LEALARRGESVIQTLYPIARLFFGKAIPNLQTSWVKLGPKRVAEMLRHGCNGFGGTLYEESITRESGGLMVNVWPRMRSVPGSGPCRRNPASGPRSTVQWRGMRRKRGNRVPVLS